MTTSPMLLAQSARYRQDELRGLGGQRHRVQPRSRPTRAWPHPKLRFVFPLTVHPRPASSR
jgi:hypothetical protein